MIETLRAILPDARPLLLILAVLWLPLGLLSLTRPETAIGLTKRMYGWFGQRKADAPLRRSNVLFEQAEGALFVTLGLLCILGWWCGGRIAPRQQNPVAAAAVMTVEEAVRQIAGAPASQPASQVAEPGGKFEIVRVRYGAQGKWVDVTEQVRRRVSDGQKTVHAGNELARDPIFGAVKVLDVEYRLGGNPDRRLVTEGQDLPLPPGPQEPEAWREVRTQKQLTQLAGMCPGQVAFFGKNLATGRTVEYRPDRPYCLASIVKLFVLSEAMRQEARKELSVAEKIAIERKEKTEEVTIDKALDLMIGQSDNDATGALAMRVGYGRVNALVKELGLAGFAPEVLPAPGVLGQVLDRRILGQPQIEPPLSEPQHGTARALVGFLEMLSQGKVVEARVSGRVREVLERNPMPFAARATVIDRICVGKGGSLGWFRGTREFNMGGWAVWVYGESDSPSVAVGILCEWWPSGMPEKQKYAWLAMLTDCLANGLASE